MITNLIRGVAAVIAALILAFAGVVGVELMSSVLHPFPPGVDQTDVEACKAHVARYPTGVLLLCAVGWWLTVLLSTWVATRLGANRHPAHGIVIGLILLVMALLNMVMLPYPSWFWINLITFPASGLAGTWAARRGFNSEASPSRLEDRGFRHDRHPPSR
jgi:hypothetical protein